MKEGALVVSVLAGGVSGIAGLAAFLTIHALWITPIWFIAAPGAAIAAAGGGCVGLAYDVYRKRLPDRLLGRTLALLAAGALVLLPAEPIALVVSPSDPRMLMSSSTQALISAVILYVAVVGTAGIAAGAWLGRSWRAALVTGLAAAAFAVGIGHNAPLIGSGWPAAKMWAIMLAVTAVAAFALAAVEARFTMR